MFSPIRPTARLNQRRFGGGRSWFSDLGLELGLLDRDGDLDLVVLEGFDGGVHAVTPTAAPAA